MLPVVFRMLAWVGAVFLAFLAINLIRSAIHSGHMSLAGTPDNALVRRGFLTSFLNPKGLMVYFAILPNFMTSGDSVGLQAVVLSAIFIALCGIVYSVVGFVVSSIARKGRFCGRRRRYAEGAAGALLLVAAGRLAVN